MFEKTKAALPQGYNPLNMLVRFLKMQATGGILLVLASAAAMWIANSGMGDAYHYWLHSVNMVVQVDNLFTLDKHIIHWINDGLMAVFFFLVGLEVKRELMEGSLSTIRKATLPLMAAVGGMAVPGLIFFGINMDGGQALNGWAIPTATDIAFAIGMVALLGKRVPLPLKVFLLAVAIFDDLGAVAIIALFYTQDLKPEMFAWAGVFIGLLFLANGMRMGRASVYMFLGVCLWFCVLKSGVHATVAGVITALFVPLAPPPGERRSPLRQFEHDLHSLVALIILPIFAFANAGVDVRGLSGDILFEPITLGVILGLFLGKPIGIFGFTYLAVKLKLADLPEGVTWLQAFAVALMAGIGFTMSFFIGTLAYQTVPLYLAEAKLGILVGSALSLIFGLGLLARACRPQKAAAA